MSAPSKALGMNVTLAGDMDSVQAQVAAALKAEGFGILTEIDVQATLKTKIDVDFRPYKILGACNPHLAHQALSVTAQVGLLLPCNVTLSEETAGHILVSIIDPHMMMDVVPDDALGEVAADAKARLTRVLKSLEA